MKLTSKFKNKNNNNSYKLFNNKKGIVESPTSASGAAVLVLLVTILIVLYLLFLPPAEREKLLGDYSEVDPQTGINSHTSWLGTKVLQESPGHINYISDSTIEHDMASFRIYTETDAAIINEMKSMDVKNSAFEKKDGNFRFTVDKYATDNVYLGFNIDETSGDLKIYLNGILLFEGELSKGTVSPIKLPKEDLNSDNELLFKVTSPGFAFWRVHEYKLSNMVITGDITDDENSFHMQSFYIAENEYENYKSGTLEFYPDCNPKEVNKISIEINKQEIYYGLPDCNIVNKVNVPKNVIIPEENRMEFISDAGNYIIDMVELRVKLNEPDYPTFYFDLSDDLFANENDEDTYCGKIDGICPNGCREYEDKDCCFEESKNNLWCDIKTTNPYDRCVSVVLDETIARCASGYEDRSGDSAEVMEDERICGDDEDEYCPSGCSIFYDKDCCYEDDSDNYWCDDVPFTGINSICTEFVTQSECDACPSNYLNEDNDKPNCEGNSNNDNNEGEEILKSDVDILFKVDFVTEDYKKVDFIINGMTIPVDTYYLHYSRVIDEQVRSGTNSIQIKPRSDVNIAQMQIQIE